MRKQNFSFFFILCISIVKLLYFSFIYLVIKLTSFLYKMAFNSFYSAYLLSNNYLLSTHSHWSPCIYIIFISFMLQFEIEFIFMSKHVTENYSNARSVEKVIGEMSASDDNIVIREQTKNTSKKRLIKPRKFYGDTSSSDSIYKRFSLIGCVPIFTNAQHNILMFSFLLRYSN